MLQSAKESKTGEGGIRVFRDVCCRDEVRKTRTFLEQLQKEIDIVEVAKANFAEELAAAAREPRAAYVCTREQSLVVVAWVPTEVLAEIAVIDYGLADVGGQEGIVHGWNTRTR